MKKSITLDDIRDIAKQVQVAESTPGECVLIFSGRLLKLLRPEDDRIAGLPDNVVLQGASITMMVDGYYQWKEKNGKSN